MSTAITPILVLSVVLCVLAVGLVILALARRRLSREPSGPASPRVAAAPTAMAATVPATAVVGVAAADLTTQRRADSLGSATLFELPKELSLETAHQVHRLGWVEVWRLAKGLLLRAPMLADLQILFRDVKKIQWRDVRVDVSGKFGRYVIVAETAAAAERIAASVEMALKGPPLAPAALKAAKTARLAVTKPQSAAADRGTVVAGYAPGPEVSPVTTPVTTPASPKVSEGGSEGKKPSDAPKADKPKAGGATKARDAKKKGAARRNLIAILSAATLSVAFFLPWFNLGKKTLGGINLPRISFLLYNPYSNGSFVVPEWIELANVLFLIPAASILCTAMGFIRNRPLRLVAYFSTALTSLLLWTAAFVLYLWVRGEVLSVIETSMFGLWLVVAATVGLVIGAIREADKEFA